MRKAAYSYVPECPRETVEEMYDSAWSKEGVEAVPKDEYVRWEMEWSFRRYAVYLDGRLAGVAFVHERTGRDGRAYRDMCFTKTRYLAEERRITFARTIPQLMADLDRHERAAIGDAEADAKPLYMHTPDGDGRSKAWFLKCGCVEDEHGLRCPTWKEVV